jgi:hypothetical protein
MCRILLLFFFLEVKGSAGMRELKPYDGSSRPGRTDRRTGRAQASRVQLSQLGPFRLFLNSM